MPQNDATDVALRKMMTTMMSVVLVMMKMSSSHWHTDDLLGFLTQLCGQKICTSLAD